MNLYRLTRDLIDIPSVTGEEEAVSLFLSQFLLSKGYKCDLQEVSQGRSNLVATLSRSPRVVLSTHLDTVPPHVGSSEDEVFIYGRGACDAKGIIAAQVTACERLRAEGVEDVGLLFTVDEEEGSAGARAANVHPLASHCDYLVNGEPTDNKLATGSQGSLRLVVRTTGSAAHSAYPEQGESAIENLLDVLTDVRKCEWPADHFFGEATCCIGTISGGTRANVIPAEAHASLHIRLATDSALVKDALEDSVRGRAQLEYLSVSEPVRMLCLEGFEQTIVRFTTDIPHLRNWGEPLLLGPGSILDAHTAHERVAKRELAEAVDLYARLVHALLARQPKVDINAVQRKECEL
ncbi:MAG: M20/M25/M40 family metallo-hydrolase [Pyrinomonadaceae bacterium]|nr:M20/M25/M40 family metallo-hydrolase [Pyrinomonadaceae bacterium]